MQINTTYEYENYGNTAFPDTPLIDITHKLNEKYSNETVNYLEYALLTDQILVRQSSMDILDKTYGDAHGSKPVQCTICGR